MLYGMFFFSWSLLFWIDHRKDELECWNDHRKIFHVHFQFSVVSVYWHIQLKETHKLLHHLLHEPEEILEHCR